MVAKPKTGEAFSWKLDLMASRPADFLPQDWDVQKRLGKALGGIVLVKHKATGIVRRLPAKWVD